MCGGGWWRGLDDVADVGGEGLGGGLWVRVDVGGGGSGVGLVVGCSLCGGGGVGEVRRVLLLLVGQ
ncbi:MAG: hypothetical protein ACRDRT_10015 [Pseudonocardiaceae bacterium]